jgi:chemotaxis protein CheY-P-specific phosphatase CheC
MNINTFQATQDQIDKFQQLGASATQKAAQAISKLVNHENMINLSETHLTDPTTLYQQFGNSDSEMVITVLKIKQDLNGFLIFVWDIEQAKRLANILDNTNSDNKLDEAHQSVIKEICNILSSSLLQEISTQTGLKTIQSIPAIQIDMLKASLDEIVSQIALTSHNSLAFVGQIELLPLNIAGFMSFILDAQSSQKLLKGLSNG